MDRSELQVSTLLLLASETRGKSAHFVSSCSGERSIVSAIEVGNLLATLGGKIDTLGGKIDTLGSTLGGKIDTLGGKIDTLGGKIDELRSQVETLVTG